ncbi:MAG TPA: ATP-dependent DNA helicase [Actinospica sp.]|nr:ATP-dependent DNA helicase [Actinospica sp.]
MSPREQEPEQEPEQALRPRRAPHHGAGAATTEASRAATTDASRAAMPGQRGPAAAGQAGRPALRSHDELRDLLGIPYTEEQIAAITAPLEPGVIVAGAGSGKTAVMAARVVWLVGTGAVAPGEVLGLTFTNKAAGELRERVLDGLARLGHTSGETGAFPFPHDRAESGAQEDTDDASEPVIATYHAFADGLIKEHGLRLGLEPSARLLADANRYTLAARAVRRAEGPFEYLKGSVATLARKVIDLDAELAEHVVEPAGLREWTASFTRQAVADGLGLPEARPPRGYAKYWEIARVALERAELLSLVEDYRVLKRAGDFVDFGDQMALGTRLAEQVPEVGPIERDKYRVVLLDEYQDTSVAQRRMLAGLFGGGHPVTAVGDPCQSIYGWRGASPSNIDRFPRHFPRADGRDAAQYALSENRRSGARLLSFANERSGGLRELHAGVRQLRPSAEKYERGRAEAALLPTHPDEVQWLGERIQGLYDSVRGDWSQIAVLVRAGNQIPDIYAELHGRGVPVEVVGLSGLLHLPEIADLVAMLDVLDDPTANSALVRLLAGPRWRIGPRDLALLGRRARELVRLPGGEQRGLDQAVVGADPTDVVSLADALADPGDEQPFSAAALARFERFAAEIRRLRRSLAEPVADVLHRILQETGLEVEIAASSAAYRQRCAETVGAFLAVAGAFTDLEGEESVTAFRTFLKAAAAHERGLDVDLPPAESKTVKILTMHKAKGLEWEVVALPHQYATRTRVEKYTTNAGKLPHELRGDGEWLPELGPEPDKRAVDRFDALMKEHAEYENQRVEYVALTRAKELMLASAHVWGPTQKEPRSANGTLLSLREYLLANYEAGRLDAWAFTPEKGEAVNPLREQQAEAEWPAPLDSAARTARLAAAAAVTALVRLPEQEWPREPEIEDQRQRRVVEGWDADLDALLDELRRSHEVQFEVPMPASLSTTRLLAYAKDPGAFAEQLFRPMPRPPAPQARRGTEFHAWVEERFGQLSLFDDADLELFGEEEDGEDLAALKAAFLRTEYAERAPYRMEAPFQLLLAGQIVRGRIDAVYRSAEGGGDAESFEVVDWKTNRRQNADPLQLAVYRLAWAELAGVPLERVSAAFLYVRTGEVVRPADLPDRAGLERLIAEAGPAGLF